METTKEIKSMTRRAIVAVALTFIAIFAMHAISPAPTDSQLSSANQIAQIHYIDNH